MPKFNRSLIYRNTIDKNSPTRDNAGISFPETLLDSIALNANKAGLPFSTAIGLVSRESLFGQGERSKGNSPLPWMRMLDLPSSKLRSKAKNISYEGAISPTLFVSNWGQRAESPVYDYYYGQNGYLLNAPVEDSINEKDINAARKLANKYKREEVSPLYHAFRLYKNDPSSYNPGDPDYPNKVKRRTDELVNYSPEIRNYMQANKLHYKGGNLKSNPWNELSLREKSEMMRVAIQNGVTNLKDTRQKYNEFAEGGNIYDGTTEDTQKLNIPGQEGFTYNVPTYQQTLEQIAQDPKMRKGLNMR